MSHETRIGESQQQESQVEKVKPSLETVGDLVKLLEERRNQVNALKDSVNEQFDQFEQTTREPERAALTFLFKAGLSNNDTRLLSLATELARAYTQNIPLERVLSGEMYQGLNSMRLKEMTSGDTLEIPQEVDVSTFSIVLPKKEDEVMPIKETVRVKRAYVKKVKAVEQTEVNETQEESKEVVTTTTNTSESPQDKFLSEHPAIKSFEGLKSEKSTDWKKINGVYYAVVTGLKTLIVNGSPRVSEPTHNTFINRSVGEWVEARNKHASVVNLNSKKEKGRALLETDLVDFLMFVDEKIQKDLEQGNLVKYEVRRDNPTVEELLAQKKTQRLRQKDTPQQNQAEPR